MSALSMFRRAGRAAVEAEAAETAEVPSYSDARTEVMQAVRNLGLLFGRHPGDAGLPLSDFVVAAYRGGWRACEKRLDSPDLADAIATALETPAAVLEKLDHESDHRHRIRAVQQVVAYGLAKR